MRFLSVCVDVSVLRSMTFQCGFRVATMLLPAFIFSLLRIPDFYLTCARTLQNVVNTKYNWCCAIVGSIKKSGCLLLLDEKFESGNFERGGAPSSFYVYLLIAPVKNRRW